MAFVLWRFVMISLRLQAFWFVTRQLNLKILFVFLLSFSIQTSCLRRNVKFYIHINHEFCSQPLLISFFLITQNNIPFTIVSWNEFSNGLFKIRDFVNSNQQINYCNESFFVSFINILLQTLLFSSLMKFCFERNKADWDSPLSSPETFQSLYNVVDFQHNGFEIELVCIIRAQLNWE